MSETKFGLDCILKFSFSAMVPHLRMRIDQKLKITKIGRTRPKLSKNMQYDGPGFCTLVNGVKNAQKHLKNSPCP